MFSVCYPQALYPRGEVEAGAGDLLLTDLPSRVEVGEVLKMKVGEEGVELRVQFEVSERSVEREACSLPLPLPLSLLVLVLTLRRKPELEG
jgi:hypothetical protein